MADLQYSTSSNEHRHSSSNYSLPSNLAPSRHRYSHSQISDFQPAELTTSAPSTPPRTTFPPLADEERDLQRDLQRADTLVANGELDEKAQHLPSRPRQPSLPVRGAGPPGGFLSTRMSRAREIAFNAMICMVQIVPQACLTACFPSSTAIAIFFQMRNPSLRPWMVAAYALTYGTFILVAGRLGDIFGHKKMVVLGFASMSLWSVAAGLSHYVGYEVFFVARAMQGIGSAMMVPNGLALLGRTYAPGSKGKILAFSLFGLCAPIGAFAGMVLGAVFTQFVQWFWFFYALAIVSAVLAGLSQLIFLAPPPSPKQQQPFFAKLRDMDWLGAFTGVSGLVCIQVAWVCAPSVGWNTQFVYMLLIMGILLIVAFAIVETRLAEQPLAPFKLLRSDVGFVLAAVGCGWASFGIWSWYLWRFLLGIRHEAPLVACLKVVPIVPVALVASVLTAYLMRTTKPAWILIWALAAFAAGPALLIPVQKDQIYWTWTFASLLIMPFGMDLSLPSAMMIMSNGLPPDKQGVAGSLVSTVVNYSISLGLGFAATAEVNLNSHGRDILAGIRGAWIVGVGLGVLGLFITIVFLLKTILDGRRVRRAETLKQNIDPAVMNRRRSGTLSSDATLTPTPIKEKTYSSFRPMSKTLSAEHEEMSLDDAPVTRWSQKETDVFDVTDMPREMESAHRRTGSWESFDVEDAYTYERPTKPRYVGNAL